MAHKKETKYGVTKIITQDFEFDIDINDVLKFIDICSDEEEDQLKDRLSVEVIETNDMEHLSDEAYGLLQQCGRTLDEDEKLIYFLTNIEDISLEQLKEATSGQQV